MKRQRKTLALLLAAAMMFGAVGCGEKEDTTSKGETPDTTASEASEDVAEEPKEPVLLEWYYRGNGQQQDTEEVEARVNELLKSYPGLEHVTINLNCFIGSEYAQAVTLAQTSGAQIDILNSVNLGSFAEQVEKGSWMPMEDYMSDELKAELPDWLWELATVDGHIYMVPNYQNAFNQAWLLFPKEYMDKYGNYEEMTATLTNWDISITEKMEALEAYVLACNEGEGGGKYAATIDDFNGTGQNGIGFTTPFDNLGNYFIIEDDGKHEVTYAMQSEEHYEIWKKYAEWYDMGIFAPDGINTQFSDYAYGNMMNDVSCVFSLQNGLGTPEEVAEKWSTTYGFECYAISVQQYDYIQNTWGAGGNGISATCEHPEEAALFIEALTTGTELGKEIYNTLVFGIEGKHYTKDANDPDRIVTLEYDGTQGSSDTSYAAMKWILGNSFYAYKNQAVSDDYYVIAKEMNESPDTVASSHNGFVVSSEKVTTQLEQLNAVYNEYIYNLKDGVCGSAGFEDFYNEYMDKLETVGVNDVIAEYQRQLDEWLAANK